MLYFFVHHWLTPIIPQFVLAAHTMYRMSEFFCFIWALLFPSSSVHSSNKDVFWRLAAYLHKREAARRLGAPASFVYALLAPWCLFHYKMNWQEACEWIVMEHFKFGHRQENFISCLDLACQHAADDLKLRRWKLLPQLDILIPPSLSTGLFCLAAT